MTLLADNVQGVLLGADVSVVVNAAQDNLIITKLSEVESVKLCRTVEYFAEYGLTVLLNSEVLLEGRCQQLLCG